MIITKPKILKSFECWIDYGGERYPTIYSATSASGARYQFYIGLDGVETYKEMFKCIKSRCIGRMKIEHHFGEQEEFERMKNYRNLGFAYMGMAIDVSGRKGWVVGSNGSMNLNVIFEGSTRKENCHPTWETTYYDYKMNIIKNYKI